MNKASDPRAANPQAGHHYTQRRFSCDQVSKELRAIDFGILSLGKTKRTRKREMFMKVNSKPMPPEPPCHIPSPPMKILSTQQRWQQQQQIIAKRQWQLQQQKYLPKSVQNNSPSLTRAASHNILTEAMGRKFSDDESYSSDSSKDAIAVSYTKDRPLEKYGSDWDLSQKQNVGNRRVDAKSSTLPNFTRGKFKSESDLRDIKFDEQPPALPPRNNPFKNSYVRKVEIQKSRTGEYGVVIDCTKINPISAASISSKVQNFPFVRAIDSKGPMAKANVKIGDYLLKVNDTPTEGIDSFVLESLIKTSNSLQLVVATFQPTNQSVPKTPVAKVNNSLTFDNLLPRSLPHGKKFHTLERISSRKITGLSQDYEIIDEISSDSIHSQATVKQRNWSDPKTSQKEIVGDTKIDFLPIAKAVVGRKTKPETPTKNQNSPSENSSGFVSEADSHENSSGGSVGIPKQEDNKKNQEKPMTNLTATANQITEGTINASKDEGPPPLPPKKIHPPKTASFHQGLYQNESLSYWESRKFAPNGLDSNPDVSFVSVSIKLPKSNKPFCPVVARHRQDFRNIQNDEVFVDQATNTGVRITFPKSISARPSAGILEVHELAGQSSKIGKQITKLDLSRRDEEIPSLVLAPPDDFADPGSDTKRPQLQSLPLVTFDNELRPTPSAPNDLSSSKIIYSGTKVTEKASKSDLNFWSPSEVLVWLRSIGLDEEVIRSFNSGGVDGKALLAMKRADLIALGLKHMEERRDFERALKRVQLRNI